MNSEERDVEIIERYLNDELSEVEKSKVEQRLNEDKGFKELSDDMQELVEGITFAARSDLKNKLLTLESKLPPYRASKTASLVRNPWALGIAASISLILVASYLVLYDQDSLENNLFDQHFEIYPNIIAPTVRSTESDKSTKEEAYYLYDLGRYDEALKLFSDVPVSEDEGAVLLYMGLSHLALHDTKNAIATFNQYRTSGYELFLPQVNWFLGLTHVKDNNISQAKEVWEEIPEQNSYQNKVKAILDDL